MTKRLDTARLWRVTMTYKTGAGRMATAIKHASAPTMAEARTRAISAARKQVQDGMVRAIAKPVTATEAVC